LAVCAQEASVSIRVGIAACVANPIMTESWWVTLSGVSPTPSPSSFRVGRGLAFRVGGEGRRCSLFLDDSGCWGLRSRGMPRLEGGLVRVRVRVTLDDGGHRYSQREQLMPDDSHDQLTVPNNFQDERIRATAPANSNGRHETDEMIRSQVHLLATDCLLRHTHLQPVAQHRGRGVWC
jgi:hypothetical protein